MPRKDTLRKLQNVLLARRNALRTSLSGDLSALQGGTGNDVGDAADAALDSEYDELHSHLAESSSRELAQVEEALQRMREGTYGICEGCDGKIPLARLQALPYVMNCVRCQRSVETPEPLRRANLNNDVSVNS